MAPSHYRIGLCADIHFWQDGLLCFGGKGSLQLQPCSDWLFPMLLDEMEAAQLDLVLHLGDATCGGGFFTMPREISMVHSTWCVTNFNCSRRRPMPCRATTTAHQVAATGHILSGYGVCPRAQG